MSADAKPCEVCGVPIGPARRYTCGELGRAIFEVEMFSRRADTRFVASAPLSTLAQDAGTTIATVRRALARLQRTGWITRAAAPSPRTCARYQMHMRIGALGDA